MSVHDRFNPPRVSGLYAGLSRKDVDKLDKTKQEFKQECDINYLMDRMVNYGEMPRTLPVGRYGDFSEVGDYMEALQRVEDARVQFSELPAKVRDRFQNDPAKFLDWIHTKGNLEEANELGLLSDEATKRIIAATAKKAEEAARAAAAIPGGPVAGGPPTVTDLAGKPVK